MIGLRLKTLLTFRSGSTLASPGRMTLMTLWSRSRQIEALCSSVGCTFSRGLFQIPNLNAGSNIASVRLQEIDVTDVTLWRTQIVVKIHIYMKYD